MTHSTTQDLRLRPAVALLIDRYGRLPVLAAAFARALAPRPRPEPRKSPPGALSAHLRRDIGLEPEPDYNDPWALR